MSHFASPEPKCAKTPFPCAPEVIKRVALVGGQGRVALGPCRFKGERIQIATPPSIIIILIIITITINHTAGLDDRKKRRAGYPLFPCVLSLSSWTRRFDRRPFFLFFLPLASSGRPSKPTTKGISRTHSLLFRACQTLASKQLPERPTSRAGHEGTSAARPFQHRHSSNDPTKPRLPQSTS